MFEGVSFPEFMSWKSNPSLELQQKYNQLRQRAKAINFGIPSGLTSVGLSLYAKSEYGILLELSDAENFRKTLITQVYPEIGYYLRESDMEILAENLGCSENECWQKLGWNSKNKSSDDLRAMVSGGVRNIIRGKTKRKDGKDYTKFLVNKVWKGLETLVTNPTAVQLLSKANNTGSEELFKNLLGKSTCTLTGRIRGKVGFTQACNTPFSGLASDGAKLAMWNLMQVGYKLVGFIHDEILIEILENSDWDREIELINKIVCSSMQELTGTIPIMCEYSLSRVWSKEAKSIYDKKGRIQIWSKELEKKRRDEIEKKNGKSLFVEEGKKESKDLEKRRREDGSHMENGESEYLEQEKLQTDCGSHQ